MIGHGAVNTILDQDSPNIIGQSRLASADVYAGGGYEDPNNSGTYLYPSLPPEITVSASVNSVAVTENIPTTAKEFRCARIRC